MNNVIVDTAKKYVRYAIVRLRLYGIIEYHRKRTRTKSRLRLMRLGLSSPEEFYEYAKRIGNEAHNLTQYSPHEEGKQIFRCLFKTLNIDFSNLDFLDLGTGYGHSLEVARSMGARNIEFIDYEPYAYTFNVLKGFKGYFFNYMVNGLATLKGKKYHVVLSKGSVNADRFNRGETLIPFEVWIKQFDELVAPNGIAIICPTFDKGARTRLTCGDSYYVCKDPKSFFDSKFSRILRERGYTVQVIKGFNEPIERFPFTFVKRFGSPYEVEKSISH